MKRGPDDRITKDYDSEYSIDEIVVSNCTVHLERMDNRWYYLGVYDDDGLMLQFSIRALSKKHRTGKSRIETLIYGQEKTDGIGGDILDHRT